MIIPRLKTLGISFCKIYCPHKAFDWAKIVTDVLKSVIEINQLGGDLKNVLEGIMTGIFFIPVIMWFRNKWSSFIIISGYLVVQITLPLARFMPLINYPVSVRGWPGSRLAPRLFVARRKRIIKSRVIILNRVSLKGLDLRLRNLILGSSKTLPCMLRFSSIGFDRDLLPKEKERAATDS